MKSLCSHGMQMSGELIKAAAAKPRAIRHTIGQVIYRAAALISMAKACANICQRWNSFSLFGEAELE